jgi:hypothetical protein
VKDGAGEKVPYIGIAQDVVEAIYGHFPYSKLDERHL